MIVSGGGTVPEGTQSAASGAALQARLWERVRAQRRFSNACICISASQAMGHPWLSFLFRSAHTCVQLYRFFWDVVPPPLQHGAVDSRASSSAGDAYLAAGSRERRGTTSKGERLQIQLKAVGG